jgi:hypothetical protein
MIDYERLERGASGVDRVEKAQTEEDPLTAYASDRLRKVIDVQKTEIGRLMRLLGIGLLHK